MVRLAVANWASCGDTIIIGSGHRSSHVCCLHCYALFVIIVATVRRKEIIKDDFLQLDFRRVLRANLSSEHVIGQPHILCSHVGKASRNHGTVDVDDDG